MKLFGLCQLSYFPQKMHQSINGCERASEETGAGKNAAKFSILLVQTYSQFYFIACFFIKCANQVNVFESVNDALTLCALYGSYVQKHLEGFPHLPIL